MRTLDELRALYEAMPIDRLREAVAEGEASFRPEAWRTIQEEVRRRREDGRWPSDSELGVASPPPTARDTDSIFANDLSAYYPGSSAAGSPGTGAVGDLLEGRNAERFQLRALLLDPRHTVAYLVSTGKGWKVPYVGFALLAYAEGIDRAAQRLGDAPVIGVILTSVTLAFVLGAWMWAFVYGGLIHLSARVLKGRKGYEDTIRALGYAFFWPAALASGASPCSSSSSVVVAMPRQAC